MSFSTSSDAKVTLFIPTWNAGKDFPEILRLMREQELDRPFEIVIIDSGSTDGTLEFLEQQPVPSTKGLLTFCSLGDQLQFSGNRGLSQIANHLMVTTRLLLELHQGSVGI